MKNFILKTIRPSLLVMLTVFTAAFVGCNEDDAPFLELSTREVVLDADGCNHQVEILSNTEWSAQCPGSWCRLTRSSGRHQGVIEVMVEPNLNVEERTATIPVTYGNNATVNLVVRQQGVETSLVLSEQSVTFYSNADECEIVVGCNHDWEASSSKNWCQVSPAVGSGNGKLMLSVDDNTSENERTATITVTTSLIDGTTMLKTVEVVQKATKAMLSVTPKEKTLGAAADSFSIKVLSNVDWEVASDCDWISFEPTATNGDGEVYVYVDENTSGRQRTGNLSIFTADSYETRETHVVKVTQSADEYFLEVPVTEYLMTEYSDLLNVKYIVGGLDCSVDAEISVDWISLYNISDEEITFVVSSNDSMKPRIAHIGIHTVGQSGAPITKVVTVVQSPTDYVLDIFFSDTQIDPKGEVKVFNLITNVMPITIRSSSDWFDVSVRSNNSEIVIDAQPNNTGRTRSGIVIVSVRTPAGELLTKNFTVTQDSVDTTFKLKQDDYLVQYQGNTITVELVSASAWTVKGVSQLPKWIEMETTSGAYGLAFAIKVAANKAVVNRNCDIVFHNTMLNQDIVLRIEQEKNPSSPLGDYKYLGKGYDVAGEYAADIDVRAFVLDWQKLIDADYIADIVKPGSTYEQKIYGKTISEYQQGLSTSASVGGSFKGFGAQVKVSFSESSYSSSENEFGLFRHTTKKLSVKLNPQLTAASLKKCMTEQAVADINGAMSANDVMLMYGTHVITGFVLGGSLDYTMSADRSAMSSSVDWGVAMSGGFNLAGTGAEVGAEYDQYDKMRTESTNFESRLIVRGGSSQYASGLGSQQAKDNWLASLDDPELWSLVDYDGSKLIPIWEFANTTARQNELRTAAINRINGVIGDPESTHKTFKINNTHLKFVSGDEGDSLADVVWKMTMELDGKSYTFEEKSAAIKKDGEENRDITNMKLFLEQSLTFTKDHTLKIIIDGYEKDYGANPDDQFYGSVTLNFQKATGKWFMGAADVTNATFLLTTKDGSDNMTQHTFKLDWKAK